MNKIKKQNFENEIEIIKVSVIKFICLTMFILGIVTLLNYIYVFFVKKHIFYSDWTILPSILITALFSLFCIFTLLKIKEIGYKIPATILIFSYFFIINFYSVTNGTFSVFNELLILTPVFIALVIFGKRVSFFIILTIFSSLIFISILHNFGIVQFTPYTSDSKFNNLAVLLAFAFTFYRLFILAFGQIEMSYGKALEYSHKLEEANRTLERKVEERTAQLKKNYEGKLESMYTNAVMGGITKPLLHDLSSPVSALVGSLTIAKDKKNKEELDLAINSAKSISQLIQEAQGLLVGKDVIEVFCAVEKFNNTCKLLRSEMMKHDIKFIPADTKNKENLEIKGSPGFFMRIITNILTNAVEELKHKKGKRVITQEIEEKGDYIVISIEDNGRGIKKENIKKIFEFDFSLKGGGKNFGMGLPIIEQTIREKFDGYIEVESEYSKYAKFILYFKKYEK